VGLSGPLGSDKGETDVEWKWTKRIHRPQKRGSGRYRGENIVDQEDQVDTNRELRIKVQATTDRKSKGKDPCKHRPEESRPAQARPCRVEILASTDQKSKE